MDGSDPVIGRDDERAWLEDAAAEARRRPRRARAAGRRRRRRQDAARRGRRRARRTRPSCAAPRAGRAAVRAGGRRAAALPARVPDGLGRLRAAAPAPRAAAAGARRRRAADGDRATLFEAIRCALGHDRAARPAVILLDDLQWSDDATLELLASLAAPLATCRCSSSPPTARTRSPRGHPLRRLRTDLRRDRLLRELTLEPLARRGDRRARRARPGRSRSPALAAQLHHRTQGVPFFVEELAAALRRAAACRPARPAELARDGDVPLPETVRDAVLLRAAPLTTARARPAEAAAVAGTAVRPRRCRRARRRGRARRAAGERAGRRARRGPGGVPPPARARRALRGRAWLRRRALHRGSPRCSRRRAQPAEVAAHWLAAREPGARWTRWCAAIDEHAAVHAYRDAARLAARRSSCGRRASAPTSGWPCSSATPAAPSSRASWPTRRGPCARSSPPAARWRRPRAGRRQRRLAAVYALQGDRERALAARRVAADAFAAHGLPRRGGGRAPDRGRLPAERRRPRAAVELRARRGEEARAPGAPTCAPARSGLEGVARAKRGEFDGGVETVRAGLRSRSSTS